MAYECQIHDISSSQSHTSDCTPSVACVLHTVDRTQDTMSSVIP